MELWEKILIPLISIFISSALSLISVLIENNKIKKDYNERFRILSERLDESDELIYKIINLSFDKICQLALFATDVSSNDKQKSMSLYSYKEELNKLVFDFISKLKNKKKINYDTRGGKRVKYKK